MTTFSASRSAAAFPVFKASGAGILCAAYGSIEVALNPIAADIYEFCRVPAGAVIVGGYFYGDDLDTDATETLNMDIGWAANGGSGTFDSADPDGLGNLGVLNGDAFATGNVSPEVGLIYPFSGNFINGDLPVFTKETTIQMVCNVTCATFTAGALSVVVHYVVP